MCILDNICVIFPQHLTCFSGGISIYRVKFRGYTLLSLPLPFNFTNGYGMVSYPSFCLARFALIYEFSRLFMMIKQCIIQALRTHLNTNQTMLLNHLS